MAQNQLAILLWVRLRTALNRVASAKRAGAGALLALLAAGGAALGLGVVSADNLVAAAARPPMQGEVVSAAGVYGDVGFWTAALMLMFFSFRIMEALYRKQDVRLLSSYPVALATQFNYRLLAAAGELVGGLVLAALYFTPVLVISGDSRAAAAFGLLAVSMAVALPFGFAVQLWAGVASFGTGGSKLGEVGRVDVGGGAPAAFSFSPAMAFVGALVVLLVLKLAVVDEFYERGPTRLFWVGVGLPLVVAVVSYFIARRTFVRHYPHLLARFYEADLIVLDSGYAYHKSVAEGRRGLVERVLPDALLPHYRKDSLQFARRYPLLRLTHVALWIGVGIVAVGGHLPTHWLALAPLVYVSLWAAPWSRLASTDIEPGYLNNMPVAPGDVFSSKVVASFREVSIAASPVALILLIIGWPGAWSWAIVCWVAAVSVVPLFQAAALRSATLAWLGAVAITTLTALLVVRFEQWAIVLPLAAGVFGLAFTFRRIRA